jgi:hypothetical protein
MHGAGGENNQPPKLALDPDSELHLLNSSDRESNVYDEERKDKVTEQILLPVEKLQNSMDSYDTYSETGSEAISALSEWRSRVGMTPRVVATSRLEVQPMEHIQRLYLYDQNLDFLQDYSGWEELHALKELHLSFNDLSSLPEAFAALSNLTTISLNHNKFATFPEVLLSLRQLESLGISHNGLHALPNGIVRLRKLRHLDLRHNLLSLFPAELMLLPDLTQFFTAHNPWNKDMYELLQMPWLERQRCCLDFIPSLLTITHCTLAASPAVTAGARTLPFIPLYEYIPVWTWWKDSTLPDESEYPSYMQEAGSLVTSQLEAVAGLETALTIHCYDQYGRSFTPASAWDVANAWNVTLSPSDGRKRALGEISCRLRGGEGSLLTWHLRCTRAGSYTLQMTDRKSHQALAGMPAQLLVSAAAAHPRMCRLLLEQWPPILPLQHCLTLHCKCADLFGNSIKNVPNGVRAVVDAEGTMDQRVLPVVPSPQGAGFALQVSVPFAGRWKLTVMIDNVHVQGSPFAFTSH